jgi:hypothetical protein
MSVGGNCRELGEIFGNRKKEFLIPKSMAERYSIRQAENSSQSLVPLQLGGERDMIMTR